MKKRILSMMLAAALALGTVYYLFLGNTDETAAFAAARSPGETLIIDAGHGGEDGGAVSLTGVPESGLNLAIALKLEQIMGLYGVSPMMLRTEDVALYDAGTQGIKEKKASDLRNRVKRVEAVENATLISIHQNTFPESKYHGAQVFYANEASSLPLAQLLQDNLRSDLDPSNSRVHMKIPDSVYLMNHITCRAVLVECGFLSNPEEEQMLQNGGYQAKIAAALAASWLQYQETQERTGEAPE